MLNRIHNFIINNGLFHNDGIKLIALSGGADSVALLLIMKRLGYNIEAVHCNFKLRGEESNRDEQFCEDLCNREGIILHKVHFDTREYAILHKVSIEMAARDLRYAYFRSLKEDIGAESICVAHHMDDQAETVLLNLLRSTGLKGLCGMLPRNGDIVRPMLCVGRKDIVDYLDGIGQNYITDSTNLIDEATRNKLRLNVLPLLRNINPSVTSALCATAANVRSAIPLLNEAIDRHTKACTEGTEISDNSDKTIRINILKLRSTPSPEYILYSILSKMGFSSALVSDIYAHLNAQTGTYWENETHIALIDRDFLTIEEKDTEKPKEYVFPEEGNYIVGNNKLQISYITLDGSTQIERAKDIATLDASNIRFPLRMRRVRMGERFVPFGMRGSKLVSDFLTDLKVSLNERRRQMIIVDANDTPLWIVGKRPDNRFRITSDTIKCLRLRYIR